MIEKLKTCPFCGSNGQVRHDYGDLRGEYSGYYVQCSNSDCIAYSLFFPVSTEAEAVEAWNRREQAMSKFTKGKMYDLLEDVAWYLEQIADDDDESSEYASSIQELLAQIDGEGEDD